MVYFDNAATSFPKPPSVARAVSEAIQTMGAPHRGTHPAALAASRALYNCREAVAALFCTKDISSVVFTSGATESLNTAVNGLLTGEDHVITTVMEHNASLRPLYRLGCELDFLPCDAQGCLMTDDITCLLKKNTRAVLCSHISNVTGYCADVMFLSHFCRENGLYFILDCAQSAGRQPVKAGWADVLCFSGHKALFGPQGTGGMIIGKTPVRPFKVGGTGQLAAAREQPSELPDRLEAGTHNVHSLSGLTEGIRFINELTLSEISQKEADFTKRFVEGVSDNRKIKLYGDFGQTARGAIVSLSVEGYGSAEVSEILSEEYGIATRPGLHCAPLMHQALGTEKTGLTRFSFSYFNAPEEIDAAIKALHTLSFNN